MRLMIMHEIVHILHYRLLKQGDSRLRIDGVIVANDRLLRGLTNHAIDVQSL